MAFKKTSNRSALRFDRDFENMGISVDSSLSREQIIIKGSMMKQFSASFAELLGDSLSNPEFAHWELDHFSKYAASDIADSTQEDATTDGIHAAAYYDTETLGKPLFGSLTKSAVPDFNKNFATANNTTIFGAGVSHQELCESVEAHFNLNPEGTAKVPATYAGGEYREDAARVSNVAIAFPVNEADRASARVAATILGAASLSRSNEKCGYGGAGRLNEQVVDGQTLIHSASAFASLYSDNGLLGIRALTLGPATEEIAKIISDQFKGLAAGVTEAEVSRARNALKARLLISQDSQEGQLSAVAEAVALTGTVTANSTADAFAAIDAVTPSSVQAAVANSLKAAPAVASVGDLADFPRYTQIASLF
jgi:predicted Zn-dependent peptidase